MPLSSFQEAIDYLYSFADFSVERSYRYSADVFELQRVCDFLHDLGNPQASYRTFHIAGTKGKGSVSALIASAMTANGYRTGLYTSPHLIKINERIRINDEPITDLAFLDLVNKVKPHIQAHPDLTVFEILTGMAFLYFAEQGADVAAVEVGLGGRLDATNVLAPIVCVITSLSYDHMHLLGNSLSDIAAEKSGIIKEGVPVVLAPQQYEAELVVEKFAHDKNAPLVKVGVDWLYSAGVRELDHQTFFIWSSSEQERMDAFVESGGDEEWAPPKYDLPLLGYHQIINATVAYAALREGMKKGLALRESKIQQGFRVVEWRGRFQILSRDPVVLVDSAHNRDSALKLRLALDDYFPGQAVTLIFGASEDKDIEGMLLELLPRVSRLIVTRSSHQRADAIDHLRELGHAHGIPVEQAEPVSKALHLALDSVRPEEVILAAGSIFVAGEVLATWDEIQSRDIQEGEIAT
jgi:dihydrofolate synthase/folylpolyglutamate synthase